MSSDSINKRNNRKRKKSFLKNARKYAKKGHYGRGSDLDPDTYQYFVRIMEAYREGFENEEDKKVFVNNVFEQTENQEVNCSCNQVGCRVVEMLLPFANNDVLKKFIEAFSSDLRKLCNDRFASHVLEALVIESCQKSLEDSLTNQYFKEFTLKISKFLLNNLEDYIWDTYGNHVIRTCLESLVQLPKEENKNARQTNKEKVVEIKEEMNIPEEYSEIVKEYGKRLIAWPQFNEICNSELTSGFLQILLKCLKKVDKKLLKLYFQKLLDDTFLPNAEENINSKILPQAFMSKSVVMLLETFIQISSSKMLTQLYAKCFKGRLVQLAKIRNTNFAVQKLLTHWKDKVEFEAIFDEMVEKFGEIIEVGHYGVLLSLAQACKRLSVKQGSFVQGMMSSLDCFDPEERQQCFVLCMSRFTKYENSNKLSNENLHKEKLNLHGTLILQAMLDFNKPIKIVNSILNMDPNSLKNLFSNSMGSHIVDSYVRGLFVGEKSREKLVRKMMGSYQELAGSKYGSRAFEAIWNVSSLKAKLQIMEELLHKNAAWSNSDHGKIIAGKVNLVLYKRSKDDWKKSFNNENKSEKILAEILK